jgi:hypothetical protein
MAYIVCDINFHDPELPTVKYMERCLVLRLSNSELIRKQINDSKYTIRILSQMAPIG